jgi:hypothetical protein
MHISSVLVAVRGWQRVENNTISREKGENNILVLPVKYYLPPTPTAQNAVPLSGLPLDRNLRPGGRELFIIYAFIIFIPFARFSGRIGVVGVLSLSICPTHYASISPFCTLR